jgi:hypothetical protein
MAETAFAAQQNVTAPCPTGAAVWQFLSFAAEDRPVLDVLGNVGLLQPYQAGQTITHWADVNLATAWMQYAQQLFGHPPPLTDPTLPPSSIEWSYMLTIMRAMTSAFNALNIPVCIDPVFRKAFRDHFCGLPKAASAPPSGQLDAQQTATAYDRSMYQYQVDYRDDWYTLNGLPGGDGGDDRPVIGTSVTSSGMPDATVSVTDQRYAQRIGNSPFGDIVAAAIDGARQHYSAHNPLQFTFSLLPVLVVPCGLPGPPAGPPDLSQNGLTNGYMARNRFFFEATLSQDGRAAEPWTHFDGTVGSAGSDQNHGFYGFPQGSAILPDGTALAFWDDNWTAIYFDSPPFNNKAQIAAGFMFYMSFLNDIITGFLSRTPQQVIQDARAFAAYQNAKTIEKNHGSQFVLNVLGNQATNIGQQQNAAKPSIQGVGAIVGALGVASIVAAGAAAGLASVATMGIAAVVTGVITATVALVAAFYQANVSGYGKDELGRLKPYFERAWLDGDCDDSANPPSIPVDSPPMAVRPNFTSAVNQAALQSFQGGGFGGSGTSAVLPAGPTGGPLVVQPAATGLTTGQAVVGLGLAGAVAWWWRNRKKR